MEMSVDKEITNRAMDKAQSLRILLGIAEDCFMPPQVTSLPIVPIRVNAVDILHAVQLSRTTLWRKLQK